MFLPGLCIWLGFSPTWDEPGNLCCAPAGYDRLPRKVRLCRRLPNERLELSAEKILIYKKYHSSAFFSKINGVPHLGASQRFNSIKTSLFDIETTLDISILFLKRTFDFSRRQREAFLETKYPEPDRNCGKNFLEYM